VGEIERGLALRRGRSPVARNTRGGHRALLFAWPEHSTKGATSLAWPTAKDNERAQKI
jgi:hypothetical protein